MAAITPRAISDYKTYLYVEGTTAGKYHKIVDIISAPATGSTPKSIDVTTLSDSQSVGIPDRPQTPSLEFEYNYTKDNFAAVTAAVSMTDDKNYLIIFQDNTGWQFAARGATYTDAVSKGKQITAKLGLVTSTVPEHIDDVTSMLEATA